MRYAVRHGARVASIFLVVLASASLSTGAALASCAEPPTLEEALGSAETVFVGTVTGVRFDGRVATFEVEDIWKGDLDATAVVNGGPSLAELEASAAKGESVRTSADRSYEPGRRYLVLSHRSEAGVLADNACSSTRVYTADLAGLRPESAYAPVPQPPAGGDSGIAGWTVAALAVAALGVVGGIAVGLRSVRRRPPAGSSAA